MDLVVLMRQVVMGISSGMVTFLMAAGVSIVMSGMAVINFGQGAFFMLGAFICFSVMQVLNFWWALLLAPLVVAMLGGLTEFLLRPLYGKSMLYQLLATMGVAFIIIDGIQTIWGKSINTVLPPDSLSGTVVFLGLDFPTYYIFIIIISGLLALGLWLMFEKTKLGMLFRAIIADRPMVANLGVDVARLFSIMFMFGVWLSGVAGVLMAPIIGLDAQMSMQVLFTIMTVLVIGGLKSMRGVLFSALIVGIANALGSMLLPWFYTLIPAALMIIVLLVKPQGLFGKPGD
ncbi:MAG TPA: branched-chain amino acid ABC transporter permease [Syntrophorhabdales bacterium]|nr:branched-chain amino acid ABC transporter permease [Syntrophorhabdales bacterium]